LLDRNKLFNMNKVMTLGEAIKEFLKQYKHSHKINESEAAQAWPEVMGKNIMALTQTVYVKGDKMVVHLKSSALRNELMMHRTKIVRALNKYLGSEIVKEVILK
jgi:hypothetical protein